RPAGQTVPEPPKPREVLANPPDRDGIAEAVIAAARQEVGRAVLFLVKGKVMTGWKASGAGLDAANAEKVAVRVEEHGVFRDVVEEKAFYKGPVLKVPQNAPLIEFLGGEPPIEAVAFPLVIKGKVVGVLYGDNGDRMIAGGARRLEGLMAKASLSLEILILKNKILGDT
ncbi:MAG TPA: hypothetical protein VJM83_02155, partial [Nitrospirota bacterium]|nr:hypothetical protein [Nitrospirota bacterium]